MKIHFAALFVFVILWTNARCQSQHETGPSSKQISFEKEWVARFNFLGLLDPYDQNISFGVEYRFNQRWSTGSDIGYVFKSEYIAESKYASGYLLRPFIRYYPHKHRNQFFEASFFYKYVSYQLTDWVGMDIVDGIPSYEKLSTFHFLKNVYEFNLKTGTIANLSRDKRLRMEFYFGLGFRFKSQGPDIGVYVPENTFFPDLYEPQYSTLTIPMGARLVYIFK